ncbi:MAG TPA: hypothetical protein DCR44_03640 [Acholeplasmatales bacterium]|nr:MAG: hypothetical protein A2Y16_01275 [Tenericutes bacterium GWF2_57_13]HAQ56477.1 hypothetical protein [Acholeplasmatales bacterium]
MKPFRMVLILASMVIAAGLLHLAVYRTNITLTNVSNVLFVVGVVFFLPCVIALTSAFKVFHGIRYVMRVLISPSFRNEYPHYKEYKDERKDKISSAIFIEVLITSAILIVTAGILAFQVMA